MGFRSVLAAPSPNVQDHEVGLPVDLSVKLTVSPGVGAPGENVKAATGGAAVTVTDRLVLFDPDALLALSVTVNFPAAEYTWVGFRSVLVPPSPKLQAQEVGAPEDPSVNPTIWPLKGWAGANVKAAAGAPAAGLTTSVRLAVVVPTALLAARVTV